VEVVIMNKWKERLLRWDFKKLGIIYAIVVAAFVIISMIVGYVQFGSRLSELKNEEVYVEKTESSEFEEKGTQEEEDDFNTLKGFHKGGREWHEGNYERGGMSHDIEDILQLTTGEKITLGVMGMIAGMLFVIYWLLVFLWIIQRSILNGADPVIFGLLTLIFNLGGVALFFLYSHFFIVKCPECLKSQERKNHFCINCGRELYRTCPKCQHSCRTEDIYCRQCGEKLP